MNINQVFSGNYLKADDLRGTSPTVTISEVEIKEFDDGKKIVIHFAGKDKQLVCNKTNASIIAENLGSSDTDDWVNKRVQLAVKKVEFQGKLVPAIRVVLQDPPPPTAKPKAPPEIAAEDVVKTGEADSDNVPF